MESNKKPTIQDRLKFLLTGKLPKGLQEPIRGHVRPYLTDSVQIGGETYYKPSEWAKMPITAKHPMFEGPDGKLKIEKAFECGGIEFYTCDPGDLPNYRYRKWLELQKEWELGLSGDFLEGYEAKIDEVFTGDKRASEEGYNIHQEFKARRKLVRTPDQMYKLISVCYFSLEENLGDWDIREQLPKIELWKRHREPHDFFFNRPMMDLLGLSFESATILGTWIQKMTGADYLLKNGLLSVFRSSLDGQSND